MAGVYSESDVILKQEINYFNETLPKMISSGEIVTPADRDAIRGAYTCIYNKICQKIKSETTLSAKIALENEIRSVATSYRLWLESQISKSETPLQRLNLELCQADVNLSMARVSMMEAEPAYEKAYQEAEIIFDEAYYLKVKAGYKLSEFLVKSDGNLVQATETAIEALDQTLPEPSVKTAKLVETVRKAINDWNLLPKIQENQDDQTGTAADMRINSQEDEAHKRRKGKNKA